MHRSGCSIFGTINLDLREATLAAAEVDVDVFNFFGTVTMIGPCEMEIFTIDP